MSFQVAVSHRIHTENMILEIRDYEAEHEEEFLMETSRLRISSALDLNASARTPVAVWQLPTNNEWIPQRQIGIMQPDIPVRVRIPKGVHRTLGCVINKKVSSRWSPSELTSALRATDERIHQVANMLSSELEKNRLGKSQMVAGLSRLFTRYVGQQLNHSKLSPSHALIAWRMRTIEDAVSLAAKGKELNLDELAIRCRMSRQYLLSQFRRATGVSLGDYVWSARADQAKRLIEQDHSFRSIADQLNYSGLSHFSSRFSRSTGISPSKYRQQVRVKD